MCVCHRVCPSHDFHVAFLFQSPDKRKVLTSQRTFDSEGKKTHQYCGHSPLWPLFYFFILPVKHTFYSRIHHDLSCCKNKTICVLQRRSSTRTTRRRPYIMTLMRMLMPENPNLTMALWSSTDPYAPPGASSLWSGIILASLSTFCYIQDANKYHVYTQSGLCLCLSAEPWNACALKNAVISSLATVHTHPPTSSAPHVVYQGVQEFFS